MRIGPKESWPPKNQCYWYVVLDKTLESHLDCKETKGVNSKGNQFRILIGRADAETGSWIFWPPEVKHWLLGKEPDAEKDWKLEERAKTEDEMLGGIMESMVMGLSTLWVGDWQGSLACCNPWGQEESERTKYLMVLTVLTYVLKEMKMVKNFLTHQLIILTDS